MEQIIETPPVVPGGRFRRNIVALGAAAGLTLAGLGVSGATTESASQDQGTQASSSESRAARGEARSEQRAERRAEHRERHQAHRMEILETAAGAIGITADELRAEMQAGKSIAAVAREKGVDPATVVDALVAKAQEGLQKRFSEMVERTPGERGERRAGGESEADTTRA